MFTGLTIDLFTPWLVVLLTVFPIIYLERWIHKHLQGVGLLMTNSSEAAVLLYYFVMLPGVIVHELGHWLMAKILFVKVKKVQLWPQKTRGIVRLGLVETAQTDPVRSALIGLGPVAAGVAVVYVVGTLIMDGQAFFATLPTGDIPTIVGGLDTLANTPDFLLWLYVLFSVSNAMMPSESDTQAWPVVGGGLLLICVALFLMNLGNLVVALLQAISSVAQALTIAFLIAVMVDIVFVFIIWLLEEILGVITRREVKY